MKQWNRPKQNDLESIYRLNSTVRSLRSVHEWPKTNQESYSTINPISTILREPIALFQKVNDEYIRELCQYFLFAFTLSVYHHAELFTNYPLYANIDDDGDFFIEWIFDNFRIGIQFQRNPQKTSWFIVSKKEILSRGNLEKSDIFHVTNKLIDYALINL